MSHSYTIQLPVFEGPLDLLLRLIEQRELDITAISLAQVADQFLAHVRLLQQRDAAEISEFLLLAAKLLLIKTRALLPRPDPPPPAEEDVAEQLARQLREYQLFKRVAEELREIEAQGLRSYGRTAPPPALARASSPAPLDHRLGDLIAAVNRRLQLMLSLEEPVLTLPRPRELTVAEAADRLLDILRGQRFILFEDLLGLSISRTEVIVTLWAVLELWKRERIEVEQETLFAPIVLSRGRCFELPGASQPAD